MYTQEFVSATGLYPDLDTISTNFKNTSNWIRNTSNQLAQYTKDTSNSIVLYVKEESNVLRTYTNNRTYVPTFGDYYPSIIYVPTPPYFVPAPLPMIEASEALLYLTGGTIENYKTSFQNVGFGGDMLKLFDKTHQILQQHEVHFSESILSAQLFNEYQNAKTTANSTAIGAQQVEIDAMAKILAGTAFFTGFNTVYNVGSFVKDAIDYFSLDSNGKLTEMATFEEDIWYNFHREPIHNTNLENMTSLKVNSSNLDATIWNPTGTGITRVGGSKSKYSYLYSFGVSPNNYLNILKDYFPEKKQLLLRWESKFSISFWVSFKQPEGFRPFTFLHAFDNENTYIKVYYSGLSFRFLIFDNWGVMLVSSSFFYPIVLNQTYHIVYTYEYQSSRSVKLYIDGILKNITMISSASTLDWFDLEYNSLQITALYQVEYMQIEDYRIMPKVLTANDITQLYKIYKPVETAIDRTSNQLLLNIQNTSNWIRSSSNEISNNFKKITNDITTRVDGIVDTVMWKSMVDPLYGPFYTDLFGRLQIGLDSTLFYNAATHKIGINFIAPLASPFFYDDVGFLQIGLDNTMTYDTQARKIGVNQGFITDKITETSNIISDRITNTSNVIINRIAETSNIISDRITNTSNVIINRIAETSNVISSRITNIDVGLSNYIRNTSNELGLTILRSSNIISDRITNVIDVGLSNYIRNTSNELGLTIARSSNIIIDRLTNVIDVGLSNYIKNTSNELGLTITRTSNIINTKIDELWLKNGNIVYNNGDNVSINWNLSVALKTTTSELKVLRPYGYAGLAELIYSYNQDPYEILYYQTQALGLFELRTQTLNNFPQSPPPRQYISEENRYFSQYSYGYNVRLKDSAELVPFYSFTFGISLKFQAISQTMTIFKVFRKNGTNATLTFNIESTYNSVSQKTFIKFYSYTSASDTITGYGAFEINTDIEYFIQWSFKTQPTSGGLFRAGFLRILIDNFIQEGHDNIPMPVDDRLNEIWVGDGTPSFKYSDVIIIINLYLTSAMIEANIVNKKIYDTYLFEKGTPTTTLLGKTYVENLYYKNMFLNGKAYYTADKTNFVSQTGPSAGTISIQDTGTRRTFYVDEVKVNGTNNLENQTNNSGYVYYSDGNSTTQAQVKSVSYNELTNKPTNFQSDWNSTIINKPSIFDGTWNSLSGKPATLNFLDATSSIQTQLNGKQATLTAGTNISIVGNTISATASGSSQWTTSGVNVYYNSGSVGIGTISPTQLLDVNGNAKILGRLIINNSTDGGNTRGIVMWDALDTNWGIYMGQSGATKSFSGGTSCSGGSFSGHAIRIRVGNNPIQGFIFENSSETCLFSVRGSDGLAYFAGDVGIGITNPSAKLDVVGNIKVSGNINNTTSTELGYLSGATSSIQTQLSSKESTISLGATQYALINTTGGKVGVSTVPLATLNYLDATSSIQTQLNSKESSISLGATQYALINTVGGKVGVSTVPLAKLNYLDATSSIQTQLNGKESTISLGATQYALINTVGGKVGVSTIPLSTLNYLDATSSIQTQLNGKQGTLTAGTNISIVGNTISATGSGSSQWTSGNGLIYYNIGSNVGIGLTNPSAKLDVISSDTYIATFRHTNLSQGIGIAYDSLVAMGANPSQGINLISKSTGSINFITSNVVRMTVAGLGNVGIGTTNPSANNKLEVQGVVNIHGGSPYAVPNGKMTQGGSLIIGDTAKNYLYTGTANGNWATTDAGCLMLECADNTEIVIHDAGKRLASFMSYEGNTTNRIQIGRTLGWEAISTTTIWGNVGIGTLTPSYKLDVNGDTRTLGRLIINNDTDGGNTRGIMMWNATDTNWGIYMASPGAGKSFSGGNACSGAGGFTAHAIRIRTHDSVNSGFIYENGSENCLFSVRANDGLTYHSGSVGIGKTPSYKLDVSGDANISGAYRVNGVPILEKYEFNWGSIAGYGSVTMLPSTIIGNTSAADGLYSYYIYETSTPTSQIFAFGTICFWANGGYCNVNQGSARFITTNHNGNNYFVIVNDTNVTRSYNMKLTKLSSYI